MSASLEIYKMMFGNIEESVDCAARCACVACNSCTCSCSCRNIPNDCDIEW